MAKIPIFHYINFNKLLAEPEYEKASEDINDSIIKQIDADGKKNGPDLKNPFIAKPKD